MNRYATLESAQASCPAVGYVAYKSDFACDPFVVARLPHLGDDVSMSFNGDTIPCGKIVKIAKNHIFVVTEDGTRFQRKGSNKFVANGCYALVRGTKSTFNWEF